MPTGTPHIQRPAEVPAQQPPLSVEVTRPIVEAGQAASGQQVPTAPEARPIIDPAAQQDNRAVEALTKAVHTEATPPDAVLTDETPVTEDVKVEMFQAAEGRPPEELEGVMVRNTIAEQVDPES